MDRVLIASQLVASHSPYVEGSFYLSPGEIYNANKVTLVGGGGYYNLYLKGTDGREIIALRCPSHTFVVLKEGEETEKPVFRKIELKYNWSVVEGGCQRALEKGTQLEVESVFPNNSGYDGNYFIIGKRKGNFVKIVSIRRMYFKVVDGNDDTVSIWDEVPLDHH